MSEANRIVIPKPSANCFLGQQQLPNCETPCCRQPGRATILGRTTNSPHLAKMSLAANLVIQIIALSLALTTAKAQLDLLPEQQLPISGESLKDTVAGKQTSKCDACRLLVKSFEKGIENTSRGKHEGGDTSWEEKNLKNYADSEIRLVEIQENLCEDAKTGKAECLTLAEENESDIEEWWFMQRRKNVRLDDFLCISRLKICCPRNKFGSTCQPCPSDCNQHGACDGSGTRSGSGKCICNEGYEGDQCESCTDNHFMIATSDGQFTCRKCDPACIGCYGFGPLNCTNCRPGYKKSENKGCIDIDECTEGINGNGKTDICKDNSYCVNTDGSYRCTDCHVSCSGCVGYGPSMCLTCAKGYEADEDYVCQSKVELERRRVEDSLFSGNDTLARYLFYVSILALASMMFRGNLFFMYSFTLGFFAFCALNEFDLLEFGDISSRSTE